MLHIAQQTQTKLILQDRRLMMTILAGFFTLISLVSVLLVAVQGFEILIVENQRDFIAVRLINFAVFLLLGSAFVGIGVFTMLNFGRGVTCVFDKSTGEMTLEKMKVFRRQQTTHSIYGISHFDVETNTDVRAYGVFMILRSGESIPIASFSFLDREHMEALLSRVRSFLRD